MLCRWPPGPLTPLGGSHGAESLADPGPRARRTPSRTQPPNVDVIREQAGGVRAPRTAAHGAEYAAEQSVFGAMLLSKDAIANGLPLIGKHSIFN